MRSRDLSSIPGPKRRWIISSTHDRLPILRALDAPNAMTLGGLALGFAAAAFAMDHRFAAAMLALMGAGIVDLFDGVLARRTARSALASQVGKHLDSLADLGSFGLVPALIGYAFGMRGRLEVAILLGYLAANAMRLGYFNAVGLENAPGGQQCFIGMPVTYAALILPLVYLIPVGAHTTSLRPLLDLTYGLLAMAMVSGIRWPKPRGRQYLLFVLLALGLTSCYGTILWRGR